MSVEEKGRYILRNYRSLITGYPIIVNGVEIDYTPHGMLSTQTSEMPHMMR